MAYKELHNVVFCGDKDCRKVYRFDGSDGSDGIRAGDILPCGHRVALALLEGNLIREGHEAGRIAGVARAVMMKEVRMALSEQEREWLERRKNLCNRCARRRFCEIGKKHGFNTAACRFWEAMNPKGELLVSAYFRESAEFEARVAANLAIDRANGKHLRPKGCSWYETAKDGQRIRKTACPPHRDIDNCPGVAACSLYLARLAAEAEMDNAGKSI